MKALMITALILAACPIQTLASEATRSPTKEAETMESNFDEELAKNLGADAYGMTTYVVAFLKAGPNRNRSPEEAAKLQRAHLDNIQRLGDEGMR